MKKFATIIAASFLLIVNTVSAEMAIGVTANFASIETDGTETLRTSGNKTTASSTEETVLPEVFVEVVGDKGAFGIAYIPVQELGNKSRSDSNSEGDTGTYTAKAELDSHIQLYANINLADLGAAKAYLVGGISQATIVTEESLNSGSTYQDKDVYGYTVGLGVRGDLPSNTFYKLEGTFTDYEAYADESSASNKIDAETEVYSMKASIGYKF